MIDDATNKAALEHENENETDDDYDNMHGNPSNETVQESSH
jgi:hypothetical protein